MSDTRLIDRFVKIATRSGTSGAVSSHLSIDDIYQFYLNLNLTVVDTEGNDIYDSIDGAEKSIFLMKDSDKDAEHDKCNTGSDITNLFLGE